MVLKAFGEGRSRADVRRNYDISNHEGLSAMVRAGQPMQGEWILEIIDRESEGPGTLERWLLAMAY